LFLATPVPVSVIARFAHLPSLKNCAHVDTAVVESEHLKETHTMPITVIAKLKTQPGKEADFEAAAKQMIATVKESEPGTLTYVLHKNTKDPTEFVYYEVYQDQAAFDSHGKTDHMKAFGGKIGSLLSGRPEISILTEVARK
jgi:quinol monooxygenase YgiN